MRLCSYTPRFSYGVLKTPVLVHVLGMTVVRRTGVQGGYGVRGGTRVGIPGG